MSSEGSPKKWFGRSSKGSTPAAVTPDSVSEVEQQLDRTTLDDEGEESLTTADQLGVADELQGDTESEQGKFRALLGILRKTLSVKDLSSVRVSLPANMMEPIGNLEHWTYIDRPDYFAALATPGMSELDRMLAILRWMFTKELKYAKHPISKPFNSVLGEHFHCYYDVPVLDLHPKKGHPLPAVHLDENPHPEALVSAGRTSTGNATAAASLKNLPTASSVASRSASSPRSPDAVASSSASVKSVASAKSTTSSAAPSSSGSSVRGIAPGSAGTARIVIINEQTSHHPPISHFVVEARVSVPGVDEPRIVRCRGVDQLSAKFTGMNVRIVPGPHNKGMFLDLPDGEEVRITHPTAAVAGLLKASPYATITDGTTVTVRLPEDGKPGAETKKRLRAIVEYKEESWITRPRFLVEGVVYDSFAGEADPSGAFEAGAADEKRFSRIRQVPKDRVVGTFEGNWRGEIKWRKAGESTSTTLVDLVPLLVVPKSVAPLPDQGPLETRRVWSPVVDALHKKDWSAASKEKQRIEQEQRDKADERKKKGETYRPRFFEPEPDNLADWDGRPVLTAEGRAAVERDFQADYSSEP
ncbi:uncharacterized protein JCM10292_005159 [Rhodotorula paludigena]|uniref:uncharacterized protein n=1 Tax=Rhodotorula paludigena TaxID=86838 RepID=UPI00317534DD